MSQCLETLDDKTDPKYKEALAIIQAGKNMLAKRPRGDMPNFKLVDQIEMDQEAKYDARSKLQSQVRSAIIAGRKTYETQP